MNTKSTSFINISCFFYGENGFVVDPYVFIKSISLKDHFCHSGGGMSIPPLPSMAPAPPQISLSAKDRYAALAELDSALSFPTTSGSAQA